MSYFKFKNDDISTLNCAFDRISIIPDKDNNLCVFANIDNHGLVCIKYSLNAFGRLVKVSEKYVDAGLSLMNGFDFIVGDLRSPENKVDFVSSINDKFIVSTKNSVIEFSPQNQLQVNNINEQFSKSDIAGPIFGTIRVNEDVVSFDGFNNTSSFALNVSEDPTIGFNKFLNFHSVNITTEDFNGKPMMRFSNIEDELKLLNDSTDLYAEVIQGIQISYNGVSKNLDGALVLGMCFFNNELFYVKTKGNEFEINMNNHNLEAYSVFCSLSDGELIEFNKKMPCDEIFLESTMYYSEYIRFKSIKVINGKLVILFENHNPVYISDNLKEYTILKSKNGIITSLDYINGFYIAGISEIVYKTYSKSDINNSPYETNGVCVMKGDNLSNLTIVETCPVVDIVVDTYREKIYISTTFEFQVRDYSFSLIRKYMVNPFNVGIYEYSNINIRSRFLLHSDIEDVRRLISLNGEVYQDTISFNDSVKNHDYKLICTGKDLNSLTTDNTLSFIVDGVMKKPEYIDLNSIPLFANNLNGVRSKDKFSIFSKDNNTGVIVELSYDNNLIVTCPNNTVKHTTKRNIITTGIIPVIDKIAYNNVGLRVNDKYILLRVGQNLRIYSINFIDNSITVRAQVTLPVAEFPEVDSFIVRDSKIFVAFGDTSILELNISGDNITFSRYITTLFKIHQIEKFGDLIICIHSIGTDVGYLGILLDNDSNGFDVYPIGETRFQNLVYKNRNIPIIKINGDDSLNLIYSESFILVLNKNTMFGLKYNDSYFQNKFDLLKPIEKVTAVLSIDNESMRNTKNRNFIKDNQNKVDSYKYPFELFNNKESQSSAIMRDFDTDKIYNIVTNSNGYIIISETFGDLKRIDITVDMGNSNIVKRIKTDKYELFVDEVLYPKISAYLENVLDSDLNKLCTFILG